MPTAQEIQDVALERFLVDGYRGASLADIATALGASKATVLYHFDSKEALLEAALDPSLSAIELLLDRLESRTDAERLTGGFVDEFIDLLIRYPAEVHLVINQSVSLAGMPVMARADRAIARLVANLDVDVTDTERRVRVGMALSGAAFMLTAGRHLAPEGVTPELDRAALVALMRQMLDPAPRTAPPSPR